MKKLFLFFKNKKNIFFCKKCGILVMKITDIYIHPPNNCEMAMDGVIALRKEGGFFIKIDNEEPQERLKNSLH
jgi:hypothetical protein